MLYPRQFYYAETKQNTLTVTLEDTVTLYSDTYSPMPMPIIWNNNGLYGIICREKVANMVITMQNQEKLPNLNRTPKTGIFYWDEVEEINQKTAKLLVGE